VQTLRHDGSDDGFVEPGTCGARTTWTWPLALYLPMWTAADWATTWQVPTIMQVSEEVSHEQDDRPRYKPRAVLLPAAAGSQTKTGTTIGQFFSSSRAPASRAWATRGRAARRDSDALATTQASSEGSKPSRAAFTHSGMACGDHVRLTPRWCCRSAASGTSAGASPSSTRAKWTSAPSSIRSERGAVHGLRRGDRVWIWPRP